MLRDERGGAEQLERSRVYDGPVFALDDVTLDYRGERLRREWLVHPGAVVVLALTDDEQVVVVRQYRAPLDAHCWELPAGLLDAPGESLLETAKRELAEEADLEASTWSTLLDAAPSGGSTSEIFRVFLATGLSPTNSAFVREGEEAHLRVETVGFEQLVTAVLAGGIHNGALQLGVLALDARRRRGLPLTDPEAPRQL